MTYTPKFNEEKATMMKNIKYLIYREGDYYVSQCLNVEVASFGSTIDD
ncbi:MAG: hypothetical protein PHC99_11415 [Methylococcales bacterium]|nr:hypothetical protein [Methylococcales bacterium]